MLQQLTANWFASPLNSTRFLSNDKICIKFASASLLGRPVDGSWNLFFEEDATDIRTEKTSNVEVMTAAGLQRVLN